MENRKKEFGFLGLARRAGAVSPGSFSTEKCVKGGRASLVIVSEEASENTRKSFSDMCTYYQVPIYIFGKKEELGRAIGREMCASLAVTDPGFSAQLSRLLSENGGSEYES